MSAATQTQPIPAHQLQGQSLQQPSVEATSKNIPIPRGPVDAVLSFYTPPVDGSAVRSTTSLTPSKTLTLCLAI